MLNLLLLVELLVLNAADWMGFCPVESHLLLLSVVLFCGTLSLFLISNCRLRLLSFSYVCFVSSESRPVSEGTCIFKPLSPVKRYRGLLCVWLFCHILSYFCLFVSGTLDWMFVMAIDSWWLGSVILPSVLLLHCTAVCLFSSQIGGVLFLDF